MFSGELHPLFEPSVLEGIVEMTPWWIAYFLVYLTYIGSIFVIVPVVVFAYWWDNRRFGPWIGAVIGYYGLMAGVKSMNSATRPEVSAPVGPEPFPELFIGWYEHATAISTTSFPSGNVMAATIICGLFVLDSRVGTFRKRAAAAAVVVLIVAYTRLGLGVHYPIDAIAGIVIGLTYLAGITALRKRAGDETLAMFTVGFVFALWSVLLMNGPLSLPTTESMLGSNRTIALGAAIGGLLVWWLFQKRVQNRLSFSQSPVPLVLVVGVTILVYALHAELSHPAVTVLWAASTTGAIVSLPWLVPTPAQARNWVTRRSRSVDDSDVAD